MLTFSVFLFYKLIFSCWGKKINNIEFHLSDSSESSVATDIIEIAAPRVSYIYTWEAFTGI